MRIGIEVSALTPTRSGVGNFLYYQLQAMMRLSPSHVFHGFSCGMGGVTLAGLSPSEDGVMMSHRHIAIPTRLLYRVWEWTGRPRVDVLSGGVDVFHATNYFLPPVRCARRVLSIYDLSFLRFPGWCSPKIVGPFARHVPRFAHEADAILTCSEAAKRDLVECAGVPPEKISVAYGAVDTDFKRWPPDEAAAALSRRYGIRVPFVLYVGTLEPRKNVAGFLEAFARIKADFPHDLVLAGAMGWGMEGLRDRITALGLEERVHQVGYVPEHRDLALFYSAAEAFLFPSFYEGYGLPVVEAMTCGCPVITSNTSSLPEVAGEAGELVTPEDIEGIAAALQRVLGDPGRRESMREKGYIQAGRFSWEKCARVTLDIYGRVCGCTF